MRIHIVKRQIPIDIIVAVFIRPRIDGRPAQVGSASHADKTFVRARGNPVVPGLQIFRFADRRHVFAEPAARIFRKGNAVKGIA